MVKNITSSTFERTIQKEWQPVSRSQTLLERMKKLVEESDQLLVAEKKKEEELDETKDITETSAFKRMTSTKFQKGKGCGLVREQFTEKSGVYSPLACLGDWENDISETRDQDSGRNSSTEEQRE